MVSDILEIITLETAILLSGIAEGIEVCNNPCSSFEEDTEELENDETALEDSKMH